LNADRFSLSLSYSPVGTHYRLWPENDGYFEPE